VNHEKETLGLLLLQQLVEPLQTVAVVGVVEEQKDSFAFAGERSLSDLFVGLLGHGGHQHLVVDLGRPRTGYVAVPFGEQERGESRGNRGYTESAGIKPDWSWE